MRNIKRALWGMLALLTVLWFLASPLVFQSTGFFALRGAMVQYSGIIAMGAMSIAMILALRPLGNELIVMIKASAIASLVTLFDLMGATRLAFARSFDLSIYLYAALIYLVLVEIIRRIWDRAELRLSRHLALR